jgi:hypothetical protein
VEMYLHSPSTPSCRDTQLGGAQGLYLFNGPLNKQKLPKRYII